MIKLYCNLTGVPYEIFSNSWTYEQYSSFFESYLKPQIKSLEYELNYKLLTKNKRSMGYKIKIRLNPMAGISFKDKVNSIMTARYQGIASQNEAREEFGWEPVEGGDEIVGNKNMHFFDKDNENSDEGGD
jgi:phage portal protein BeeE